MINIEPLSIKALAKIVDAKLYNGCLDKHIDKISLDSRLKNTNYCFFAIKGKKHNGNEFIEEALKNGAAAIVSNADKPNGITTPYLQVQDTKNALGLLARALKGQGKIVGITGSVGKTTVKELTWQVLTKKYSCNKSEKNHNNEIGVPLTLLKGIGNDFNIVEMGMRGLGEIEWLSFISEPELSVITNIGTSHIERLKSKQNIFKAKTEILKYTRKYAIVPNEEEFHSLSYQNKKTIYVGDGGDCSASNIIIKREKITFDVDIFKEKIQGIEINGYSKCLAYNALFAIAIGKLYGVKNEDIKSALSKYNGCEMRGEIIKIGEYTIINDCYNASYESMVESIISAKRYADLHSKSLVAVLGDMLELGECSREYHYRVGELARDIGIKNIISTGKYGKCILDGYSGGEYYEDKKQITKALFSSLENNDIVLFKASRGVCLEKVIEQMREILK